MLFFWLLLNYKGFVLEWWELNYSSTWFDIISEWNEKNVTEKIRCNFCVFCETWLRRQWERAHQHGQVVHMSLYVVSIIRLHLLEVLQLRSGPFTHSPHERVHPPHTAWYAVPCEPWWETILSTSLMQYTLDRAKTILEIHPSSPDTLWTSSNEVKWQNAAAARTPYW